MIFECCVASLASARAAIEGGATRLELCSALELGGLSPSPAFLQHVIQMSGDSLPVHALVRCRPGDFCYDSDEILVMEQETSELISRGAQGIVFGATTPEGYLDLAAVQRIVSVAKPIPVVFHRAFDIMRIDCFDGVLKQLANVGVTQILTSGRAQSAIKGIEVIREMVEIVKRESLPLKIIAGSGINHENVGAIIQRGQVQSVHGSCSVMQSTASVSHATNVSMSVEHELEAIKVTKKELVQAIAQQISMYYPSHYSMDDKFNA